MDDIETLDRLQEILHIPPLPGTAVRLLALVNDPEADLGELARVIEQDPSLAARIVGIANSAWFARGREVVSVEDAVIRVLGLDLVRGLALGMTLGKPFDVHACQEFDLPRYWYIAFVTGSLARDLAPAAGLDEQNRNCAFLAGLLHDFGLLVLVHAFPRRMGEVLRRAAEASPAEVLSLERETLAIDRIQAGRFVTRRWHLPACVIDTLGAFAPDEAVPEAHRPLADLVRWAADVSERLHAHPEEAAESWLDEVAIPPVPREQALKRIEKYRGDDEALRQLARALATPESG